MVPLEILQKVREKEKEGCNENGKTLNYYDKDKSREMILDAAGTVLGYFGFDRVFMKILGIIERKRNGMMNCRKTEQKISKQRENDGKTITSSIASTLNCMI